MVGYCPVMSPLRLGAQTGACVKARVKRAPLLGERVEVRRDGVRVAVAAEVRRDVLGDDPDDVRPLGRGDRGGCHDSSDQRDGIILIGKVRANFRAEGTLIFRTKGCALASRIGSASVRYQGCRKDGEAMRRNSRRRRCCSSAPGNTCRSPLAEALCKVRLARPARRAGSASWKPRVS